MPESTTLLSAKSAESKPRRLRRVVGLCVLAPILAICAFGAAYAYHIYASNKAADRDRFPAYAPPENGQSILIVSPHPDDETLGAGGLIQYGLANHIPVHVVFMTDGDAFRVGVAGYYHEMSVQPGDYIRYGEMREGEARSALGTLGLPSPDITFLGYPDQGLMPIWRGHWYANDAYQSHFDGQRAVPYPDAFHPGSPFCGQAIVADLDAVITKHRPTDIYTTHPSDDHPDHAASPAFIDAALAQLVANGNPWAAQVHVHYFIIHRGDWPVPQGLHPTEKLAPPSKLIGLDTNWQSLPLNKVQTTVKQAALNRYGSQQEMMGRFLTSFVRTSELFGDLDDHSMVLPDVSPTSIKIDGDGADWPREAPLDLDPNGDSVIRDFQPGADLSDVYACVDKDNLYIRFDTKDAMSPSINYVLFVRAFDAKGETPDAAFTVTMSPRNMSPGVNYKLHTGAHCAYKNSTMEIAIPWNRISSQPISTLGIEATTMFSRVTVDKTGIRRVAVPSGP